MFENPDNIERCPVTAFLCYKDQRPPEMLNVNSPFYLTINTELPKAGKCWYKNAPLSKLVEIDDKKYGRCKLSTAINETKTCEP